MSGRVVVAALLSLVSLPARGELPTGYLVWSKGKQGDMTSRKIYRMSLPDQTDVQALTSGEDVGCQISPDGKWVAYAKAKLSGGTDYHAFNLWQVHVVHIDGVGAGHPETLVGDGYWPSWGKGNVLHYSTVDGTHTKIVKVTIDGQGKPGAPNQVLSTKSAFPTYQEINECFVAPDGSWFAGRTRGNAAYTGVGAYQVNPPKWELLGQAGSSGCMPYVAPDGSWGLHAGSTYGILWGDAPHVSGRKENQTLIPARSGGKCYHPGISTDGRWVLTGHSTDSDQNAGAWDLYIYRLDPTTKQVSDEKKLASGGFNGWPHVWVQGSAPPAPAPDGPPAASDAGAGGVAPSDGGVATGDAVGLENDEGTGGSAGLAPAGSLTGGCRLGPEAGHAHAMWILTLLMLLTLRLRRR